MRDLRYQDMRYTSSPRGCRQCSVILACLSSAFSAHNPREAVAQNESISLSRSIRHEHCGPSWSKYHKRACSTLSTDQRVPTFCAASPVGESPQNAHTPGFDKCPEVA
jgi:hypothetical protein